MRKLLTSLTIVVLTVAGAGAQGYEYYDRGETQTSLHGVASHACPANYAMGGINFGGDGNTFACRYVGTIVAETAYSVVREGMLACAPGSFMTALNIERNFVRCSSTGSYVSEASLTRGYDSGQVTECGGSNPYQATVMVGFHKERKVMLCAAVRR